MELKKALELAVTYYGKTNTIRVDTEGRICLNDLAGFFSGRPIKDWLDNRNTQDYLSMRESKLGGIPPILRKTGKRGGTYAEKNTAMKFAMWLSPEFEDQVITAYESGTQRKENWNIKRIMAANNYKIMSEAIKNAHEKPMFYHYTNEAKMLNVICFGKTEPEIRETASEDELDSIAWLEQHNAAYIDAGMDYETRKELLEKLYKKQYQKLLEGNE